MAERDIAPAVGKFRPCEPVRDCNEPFDCPARRDERHCGREITVLFSSPIQIPDLGCEAARAAQNATFEAARQACESSKEAKLAECRSSASSALLCKGVKQAEVASCETAPGRLESIAKAVRSGRHSQIPRSVQTALAKQFPVRLMRMVATNRSQLVDATPYLREEIKRQGWAIAKDSVVFRDAIPSEKDLCAWIAVLATAQRVEQLGADGYCQVVQFQSTFLGESVARRVQSLSTVLGLRCPPRGSSRVKS
jgi:hypothetical protein